MYELVYDADSIRELLNNFNLLTGASISFASYDYKYVVSPLNIANAFCKELRKNACADKKCVECDRKAFETAERTKSFYIYECHAGLTEAISPIIDDNRIIGYLFMGKVLMEEPTSSTWERVYRKCSNYDLDFEKLKSCFYECHSLSREKIHAAAKIMDMSAKYICLTKLAKIKSRPLIENIREYIDENLKEKITTEQLCRLYNISLSHLCHTAKQELGMPISKYILGQRIKKACYLLEKTDFTIKQVSENVGLPDQNFFARVFKKATGLTPTQYRINLK